ncbi:HD domain-containing phosphohydrolase [Agarivorans sp. MS3-6]|uniref:HD domain-containing phosphohydrolase n=1 Tax=Agarivorans sp. TSD2052 TaxID=2937286 RepID=UPI0020103641|nr:HD domain-containing phosphohydrolase [Agarivorans sp. TSD2052]UPW19608.1 metal-dependent phosphohydrolase [Agarivorans sp. TSD2052]
MADVSEDKLKSKRRFSFHLHLVSVMILMLIASGLVIGTLNYLHTSDIVAKNQARALQQVGRATVSELEGIMYPAQNFVHSLATMNLSMQQLDSEQHSWLPMLYSALSQQRSLSAVYMGYADGDFYLVRPLNTEAKRGVVNAPEGAVVLVTKVVDGISSYDFFDEQLKPLVDLVSREYQLDPRERPWYQLAMEQSDLVATDPYVFYTTKEVGVTFAHANNDRDMVVGADITLASVSKSLNNNLISRSSQLVMFDEDYSVIAHQNPSWIAEHLQIDEQGVVLPRLDQQDFGLLSQLASHTESGNADSFIIEGKEEDWIGQIINLTLDVKSEREHLSLNRLYLGLASPEDEILMEARTARDQSIIFNIFIVLISIPIAWYVSRLVAKPLRELMNQNEAIMAFDFDATKPVNSIVLEVHQLSKITEKLKVTIQQFADVSTMLGEEDNFSRLLEKSVQEMQTVLGMSNGAIWLVHDQQFVLQTPSPDELSLPKQFVDSDSLSQPLLKHLLDATSTAETKFKQFEHEGKKLNLVVCPMINRDGKLVGMIASFSFETVTVSARIMSFIDALSSVVTIAIENRHLIESQKHLLEAFIKLTAGAIDAKSPYTGGHCQRVPELTKMLASAAVEQQHGAFSDFTMSDDQWEELYIASWLHDCGKVTTPEYVVDKATKLETIYDRIHEVRMRFEVLKRDAQLNYWQEVAKGIDEAQQASLHAILDAHLRQLDEEFAFVAQSNIGGEFMGQADIERLHEIAQRTWLRTIDDRLGLSHMELDRRSSVQHTLPIEEKLLDDKAEHIVFRREDEKIAENNPWGFKLKVPEYKYNRGELYNLSIARGTLTEEERYKINDHIVQTIIMLDKLPFPDHLRRVPEIAGGHHEKMDGSGYPMQLTKEQMPATARMMAVADIFEALTAVDRPYKKGKSLSQSLKIMHFMCKDQHIDSDIFRLFLQSGVYLEYANLYLKPEQIDTVNIEDYLPEEA